MKIKRGKFAFTGQDNFEKYLKAANVGMIVRNRVAAENPDLIIEMNGNDFTISSISKSKMVKISFSLSEQFEADIGFDKIITYLPSLTNDGNSIRLQDLDDNSNSVVYTFTQNQLILIYSDRGVTGSRYFKAA